MNQLQFKWQATLQWRCENVSTRFSREREEEELHAFYLIAQTLLEGVDADSSSDEEDTFQVVAI